MPQATSVDSIPRPTSPRASSSALPMSWVTSWASSSRLRPERLAEREDGAGPLRDRRRRPRRAGRRGRRVAAASTSASVESGTRASSSPVAGSMSSRNSVVARLDPLAADVVLQRLGARRGPLLGAFCCQRLRLHRRSPCVYESEPPMVLTAQGTLLNNLRPFIVRCGVRPSMNDPRQMLQLRVRICSALRRCHRSAGRQAASGAPYSE